MDVSFTSSVSFTVFVYSEKYEYIFAQVVYTCSIQKQNVIKFEGQGMGQMYDDITFINIHELSAIAHSHSTQKRM